MSKTIIFDTEATGIKEPVLIEAAWVELESIEPLLLPTLLYSAITLANRLHLVHLLPITSWMRN